jgi:hypothetical protein
MDILVYVILFFSCFCMYSAAEEVYSNNITIHLEHALEKGIFSHRSRLQIVSKPDGKFGTLYVDRNVIEGESLKKFKGIIDQRGLYTLKVTIERQNERGNSVLASIPVVRMSLHFKSMQSAKYSLF